MVEFRVRIRCLTFSSHNADKRPLTAYRRTENMHVWPSRYRHHGQLSRSWIPNLSCDGFNKSCSAKSKIAPTVLLPNKANRHSLLMKMQLWSKVHKSLTARKLKLGSPFCTPCILTKTTTAYKPHFQRWTQATASESKYGLRQKSMLGPFEFWYVFCFFDMLPDKIRHYLNSTLS